MKILVTGGTGYIGSHTAVELLNNDYEVVIIDNLSNSKREVVVKITFSALIKLKKLQEKMLFFMRVKYVIKNY